MCVATSVVVGGTINMSILSGSTHSGPDRNAFPEHSGKSKLDSRMSIHPRLLYCNEQSLLFQSQGGFTA